MTDAVSDTRAQRHDDAGRAMSGAAQGGHVFGKAEQPAMPGGPYMPQHPMGRRIGYAVVGLSLALLASFGNSLVSNNLSEVAGEMGLYSAEAGWLTVAYTGFSASANLFLIKGRQEIGIWYLIQWLLGFYALASAAEVIAPGFATAIVGRGANGLVTSTSVALGVYYMLQVLPQARRPAAIVIILACVQMGGPLARLVPVDLVTGHGNSGLHLINTAIPLLDLALILIWPLPPTPTMQSFEWRDIGTVALLLPGIVLMTAVLALGRAHWWWDTPWLGWLAAAAVPLLGLGVLYELARRTPALWIGWISRGDMLRFAAVAFFERIAVAEQGYGAVGLLSSAGLDDDQFHVLFLVVLAAMVAGTLVATFTLSAAAIAWQVAAALAIIAVAAWIDGFSNGLTRMPQMYGTQAMIGFGTTLFVGPALLYGVLHVMKAGPQYLMTMIMAFSFTQNIGSLAGTALLSSYDYVGTQTHGRVLDDGLRLDDPRVAAAARQIALALAPATPDAGARGAAGVGSLYEDASGQAGVLAYVDVFRLIAALSAAGALFVAAMAIAKRLGRAPQGRPA